MAASAEFLAFLKDQMAGFGPVTARRMFGGAGLYREGVMFGLVAGDTLYFKADGVSAARFDSLALAPFSYATKTGVNTIASYRRAPESCFDDPADMALWCRLAFDAGLRAAKATPRRRRTQKHATGD